MGSYEPFQFAANPSNRPGGTAFSSWALPTQGAAGSYPDGASAQTPWGSHADSRSNGAQDEPPQAPPLTSDPSFDIIEWHPAYQSCQRFFLDHAQHEAATQALCALINIRLPFQWLTTPIYSSIPAAQAGAPAASPGTGYGGYNNPLAFPGSSRASAGQNLPTPPNRSRATSDNNGGNVAAPFASLVPYIRRLVVTGFDKPAILHGFFGDDFARGVLPHVDCERRNYLFAAKHGGWRSCKKQYDLGSGGGGDETLPFMKPLDEAKVEELLAAEKAWSGWLAMEDWMVGPRAPDDGNSGGNSGSSSQQTGTAAGAEQPRGATQM